MLSVRRRAGGPQSCQVQAACFAVSDACAGNSSPPSGVEMTGLLVSLEAMMWRRSIMLLAVAAVMLGSAVPVRMQAGADEPQWQAFIAAASADPQQALAALADIAARWRDSYAAMIVDVVRFLPSPRVNRTADEGPSLDLDDTVDRAATGSHAGPRRLSADAPIISGRRHPPPVDQLSRTADTSAIRRRPARLAKMDVGASRQPACGLRLVQGRAL